MPCATVSFRVTLSYLFNDTKYHAVSLRQLSFLFRQITAVILHFSRQAVCMM